MQENKLEKKYNYNNKEEIIIDFLSKFFDPYGYRNTNRSTILAKAYIVLAKRYPLIWIKPIDHYNSRLNNEHLMNLIYNEIHKLGKLIFFDFKRNEFMYIGDEILYHQ